MSSNGIVLRRNRFLANQGHRSYGVLMQTVENSLARREPDQRQHRRRVLRERSRQPADRQPDRTQSHRHPRVGQLRRQPVRRQPLRRQPPYGRDDRRQPDQPLGRSAAAATTGTARSRSIWIATASPTFRTASSICSGGSGAISRSSACLPAVPAERLLRFVHARLALPGLPGSSIRRRSCTASHTDDYDHRSQQILRTPPVLDALDLDARPGEVTLLVGANGSGKTTTLRQLCGLSSPDAGRVVIGGADLASARMAALAQAVVPAAVAALPRPADRRRVPRFLRAPARAAARHASAQSRGSGTSADGARRPRAGCPAARASVSRSPCCRCPMRPCSCSTSPG